jgi:hypothetical protein
VKDGQGSRLVPKIVAAAEVCLNNAIKGDLRSFIKIMEIVQKFNLIEDSPELPGPVVEIRRTIVDPKYGNTPIDSKEYLAGQFPASEPSA